MTGRDYRRPWFRRFRALFVSLCELAGFRCRPSIPARTPRARLAVALLEGRDVPSTVYTWTGTASNVWSCAANWDPTGGPPGAGDTAVLPSVESAIAITAPSAVTVGDFQQGDSGAGAPAPVEFHSTFTADSAEIHGESSFDGGTPLHPGLTLNTLQLGGNFGLNGASDTPYSINNVTWAGGPIVATLDTSGISLTATDSLTLDHIDGGDGSARVLTRTELVNAHTGAWNEGDVKVIDAGILNKRDATMTLGASGNLTADPSSHTQYFENAGDLIVYPDATHYRTFSDAGDFTQDATGTLEMQVKQATTGNYDQISAASFHLAGSLKVTMPDGKDDVAEGNDFPILSGGPVTGTFDTLYLPTLDNHLAFQIKYNADSVDLVVVNLDPPPDLTPNCDCGTESLVAAPQGRGPTPVMTSSAPVRYADGTKEYSVTDLDATGFGFDFGQTRSYSNAKGYTNQNVYGVDVNGTGWVDSDLPYLLPVDGTNTLSLIANGTDAYTFTYDALTSSYVGNFGLRDTLTHVGGNFVFTDESGQVFTFADFGDGVPSPTRGQLVSLTDAGGDTITVTKWTTAGFVDTVQRSVTISGVTTTDQLHYVYNDSTVNAGLLQSVTWQRQVAGGAFTTEREVTYSYYDGTQDYGNPHDLMLATVTDGTHTLQTDYYRYYGSGESGGFTDALEFTFEGESFARLVAAHPTDYLTADGDAVKDYADYHFTYNSDQSIASEDVQGQGCACSDGLGMYSLTYATSGDTCAVPNCGRIRSRIQAV